MALPEISQVISTIDNIPDRLSQNQQTFDQKATLFAGEVATMCSEMNTWANQANALVSGFAQEVATEVANGIIQDIGNALVPHKTRHATGGADALTPSDIGALAATGNLNELENKTTARTNLGVAIGTNVQAYSATLTSWAGKTVPSGTVVGTSDEQTLTSKTLTAPTITGFTETQYTLSGTTPSVDLANGTIQKLTTSGNTTITLPSSVAGKSYTLIIAYGGSHSLTFSGGSTIKWPGGATPTPQSISGKIDLVSCLCDGTNTYLSLVKY